MMVEISKGKSPFYPGQPVPLELFVGRGNEVDRIINRGSAQVEQGKPVSVFVQGEYGIGKSSFASYVQAIAEKKNKLHGIYASLGGCNDINDVSGAVLEATIRSGALDPSRADKIRNWLSKYVGSQSLFGLTIDLNALKKDAPQLSSPHSMLSFLRETRDRLKDNGVKGIFLVLDEINGIVSNPKFSLFIKGMVDSNALSRKPIPLMLMLCGVEEKRREMIHKHEPIDRIFDIVEISALDPNESNEFFSRAFRSVQMKAEDKAIKALSNYSAGFPKIMHLVGDAAYWLDKDGVIDKDDAFGALILAADDVGKKYVDQQVLKALKSPDYHSILGKIGAIAPDLLSFKKSEVESELTSNEKKKFNNFLQRMKRLNVLRSGDEKGEYIFNMRMVRLYFWLKYKPR